MDKVSFLGATVGRLIIGDNPVNGHSYIPEYITSADMIDYYTEENLLRLMRRGNELGIDTWMPLANEFMLRAIRHFRNEGGRLNVIFQSYPAVDFAVNVREMAAARPLGVYHQGTTTDYLCETGQFGVLRDRIKMLHDAGLKAGLGTHVPETILRAEDEDWGCDFYAACLHNARKRLGTAHEESSFITGKPKHLKFYMEDRAEMLKTIGLVAKPCIAFKIFAGGQMFYHLDERGVREAVEGAFRETFTAIKPDDLGVIGLFQRDKDQLGENVAAYERAVLGK